MAVREAVCSEEDMMKVGEVRKEVIESRRGPNG